MALPALLLMLILPAGATAAAPWVNITSPGAQTTLNPIPEMTWDGTGLWITWGSDAVDVEVSRWDGTSWTTYPQPINETTRNKMPAITWDGTKPWVAWNDDTNAMRVAYWTGTTWTQITSPGNAGTLFATPDLLWANGSLYAAWQDSTRTVRVARWSGSTWISAGSPGSGNTANAYPNLGWDGTKLWAVHAEPSGVTRISNYNGTSWTSHSTDSSGTTFNTVPSIEFVGTRPYMIHESTGHVAEVTWWDGNAWADTPTPGGGPTSYAYGNLVWTGSRMYVSYVTDPDNINVAYVDPAAPNAPTALTQLQSDGSTVISGNAWTRFGAVSALILRATHADAESGEQLTPWVELQPNGASLTGVCGQRSSTVLPGTAVSAATAGVGVAGNVSVTGLTNDTPYAWRSCAVDRMGFPGAWVEHGVVPDLGVADLRIDSSLPTAANVTPATAATGVASSPTFTATYTDPLPANPGTVEFQICTTSACSTTVTNGTGSSASVASGTGATWTTTATLTGGTTYWWRSRSTDSVGNVGSAWTTATSFTVAAATAPSTPVHVSPASGSATAATMPTFTASFSDANGGTGTVTFEVCSVAMTAGQTCAGAGGTVRASGTSSSTASGSNATWAPLSPLATGTVYWHARASDGSLNSGWSGSWSLRVGTPTMTVTVNAANVALGDLANSVDKTGTSTVSVTTDSSGGYQLVARDESDLWGADATTGGGTLADWSGTSETPTRWDMGVAGGMGITVLSVSSPAAKDTARWGTGITAGDFTNNRYAGLKAGSDTIVHSRTSYAAAADTVTVGWRMNAPTNQLAGTYEATVTWTATALL